MSSETGYGVTMYTSTISPLLYKQHMTANERRRRRRRGGRKGRQRGGSRLPTH
jgi:hypothetical protein